MKTTAAQAGSLIRKDLKKHFPGIKFTVKSSIFANGDSVYVGWENGATDEQVTNILKKYEYGTFDCSEDIYVYDNDIDGLPQVKWLGCSRNLTEEFLLSFLAWGRKKYHRLEHAFTLSDQVGELGFMSAANFLRRKVIGIDLTNFNGDFDGLNID